MSSVKSKSIEDVKIQSEQIEEYCIENAKASLIKNDPFLAKSWFLTAYILFPNSFRIQFERYLLAKEENNTQDACKHFNDIFVNFPLNDEKINSEIQQIVESVKNPTTMPKSLFYRQLFHSFTPESQHRLLISVANLCEDPIDLCQLMLLILKKFPNKIHEHGINLVNIVIKAGKNCNPHINSPEFFNRLLVYEVLPVILSSESNLEISSYQLLELLDKTIKFYISQSVIGKLTEDENSDFDSDFVDDEIEIKFEEVFNLVAQRLSWSVLIFEKRKINETNFLSGLIMSNFQRILSFYQSILSVSMHEHADGPIDLSSSNPKLKVIDPVALSQVFYSTLVLFLKCLNKYIRETAGKLILVEQNLASNKDVGIKKRKLNVKSSSSLFGTDNLELQENFMGAIQCFEFLHHDYQLKADFLLKLESFDILKSRSYEMFQEDYHIFKGNHENVLKFSTDSCEKRMKSCLQLISSSIMMYDYFAALKHSFNAISMIGKTRKKKEKVVKNDCYTSNGRVLFFVNYSPSEILSFCIDVIIFYLKDQVLLSLTPTDLGLGHLIVLCQHAWPKEIDSFLNCISLIRKSASGTHSSSVMKFSYPFFCDYIFNPDMLEEFMALVNTEGLHLELKEQVNGASQVSKFPKSGSKSMTTRGVNKNAKEEIRSALMNQIKNSKYVIEPSVFIDFISVHIKEYFIGKVVPLSK